MKLPSVNMSASLFLVSTYLDLDMWVKIDSVKQPIKRDSVGSGHVSHRGTSAFNDHFDDRFAVFKNGQLRLALSRMCVCENVVHIRQLLNVSVTILFGFGCVLLRVSSLASVSRCR